MRKIFLAALLSVLSATTALADTDGVAPFIGLWQVDFDRTLARVQAHPEYKEENAERTVEVLTAIVSALQVRLTEDEMIYVQPNDEMKLPYTVESTTDDTAVIKVSRGQSEATLTFTRIDEDHMQLKSSATEDFDNYVWKRAGASEAADAAAPAPAN